MNRTARAAELALPTPPAPDGRGVAPELGALTGEAAPIEVREPSRAYPLDLERVRSARALEGDTYYGMPVLKEPVWKAYVPAYFYAGGVVGASAALGAAAQLVGGRPLLPLARRARWTAALFSVLGAALLIADLGRPSRFLYMMRVFRPTSPMNLGTWVVAGCGGASGVAALFGGSAIGRTAGFAAGVLGLPMAGYTAVLVANTAVPIWQNARRSLPVTFMASGITAAASLLELFALAPREARVVEAYGAVGKVAELVGMRALEYEVARGPAGERVALPLRRGGSSVLWRAAKVLVAASLAVSLLPGERRKRLVAGALGTAGAIALRFAVMSMGRASARDPRATIEAQRATASARGDAPDRRRATRGLSARRA